LILRKITEIVHTRCHTLKLKCTTFDSAKAPLQIPLGELTAIPDPLAEFKGPIYKGKGGGRTGRKGKGGERGEGSVGERRIGDERGR